MDIFNKTKISKSKTVVLIIVSFIFGTIIGTLIPNLTNDVNIPVLNGLQTVSEPLHPLKVTDSKIVFNDHLLAERDTLPQLFTNEKATLGKNLFYQSNFEGNFFKLDLMSTGGLGEMYWNKATAIYQQFEGDNDYPTFKQVLVSSREQSIAGFPQTAVLSHNPYTLRFHYDIAHPLTSDGYGSRAYWADHYEWDKKVQKFINTNYKFGDFYKELLKEYEGMDKAGCDSTSNKGATPMSLTELYTLNDIAYCDYRGATMTNREELERFIEYKHKVEDIVNSARP